MYMIGDVTPTAFLRFVMRDGKRILQQLVRVNEEHGTRSEWRDIPLEDETK